jgi:aminoglycoside 3-N-acetyltransferase
LIMTPCDYTRDDLVAAIGRCGIGAGDIVSLQVSLGRLGRPRGVPANYPALSNFAIDAFLDVLGPDGTLIVPTYTYSIGKGETFEVENTPSRIGEFSEVFRRRPEAVRSRDPMLSSAGIGPKSSEILRTISRSCYGEGSTYQRLREAGGKICTLGVSLYWATFRHHIEEAADVPFRFRKVFEGVVREDGIEQRERWIYFAAPLLDCCAPVGLPLELRAREAGLVDVAPVGRGEVMTIDAQTYFDFGYAELKRDPWLTAKGPSHILDELVRLDDSRVGAAIGDALFSPGASGAQAVKALAPLSRDSLSTGYDVALDALVRNNSMAMHFCYTGAGRGTAIVPEKWICRGARIETLDGQVLTSMADGNLRVAAHSRPLDAVMARDVLLRHLYADPFRPETPSRHSLVQKNDWGLCSTLRFKQTLAEKHYRVVVDTAFSFGRLRIGEMITRGESNDGILLCARLDGDANHTGDLTGAVGAIGAMRWLAKRPRPRFTYRLIILPGAIDPIAALDLCGAPFSTIRGGLVLESAPSEPRAVFRLSRAGDDAFDQACCAVLSARQRNYAIEAAGGSLCNDPVLLASLSLGLEGISAVQPTEVHDILIDIIEGFEAAAAADRAL